MTTSIAPARPRAAVAGRRLAATVLVAAALAGSLGACRRGTRPPAPTTTPTTAAPQPPPPPPTTQAPSRPTVPPPAPTEGWQGEMLAAVNAERAKAGLGAMASCGTINRAAQSYAEAMAARGVLSHSGADGSSPATRMRAAGYVAAPGQRYMYGAENIAQGYKSVADVMRGWMGSQGHRDNLLAPATTHIGMGRQGDWWVQNFGTGGVC